MAYVICEPCVGVKDKACVAACPVDCIYFFDAEKDKLVVEVSGKEANPNPDYSPVQLTAQLFIDPNDCIDCQACVEPCPVDAIYAESDVPEKWASYIEINKQAFA